MANDRHRSRIVSVLQEDWPKLIIGTVIFTAMLLGFLGFGPILLESMAEAEITIRSFNVEDAAALGRVLWP